MRTTNKPLLTPKQVQLLSNLADTNGNARATELVKRVVAPFHHAVFTRAHVVGYLLMGLAARGYCYSVRVKGVKGKFWNITELGVYTLLNEVANDYSARNYLRS